MNGSVTPKGKKWYYVIYLGKINGQKKQKWSSSYNTKREAQRALRETLHQMDEGTYIEPTKETVGSYMVSWLAGRENSVEYNTFKKYRWLTEHHVVPNIGSIELAKLAPQHLQELYTTLLTKVSPTSKTGKPLSKRSVLHVHNMIHMALDQAVNWGMIHRNVSDVVKPPKPTEKEFQRLSSDELRHLLDETRKYRYGVAFFVTAMTGMRKAEVFGLRWQDVDLSAGVLRVRQTLQYVKGVGPVFKDTKTVNGRRDVAIDPVTMQQLRNHRKAQLEERLLMGHEYKEHDLVFSRNDGRPASYSTVDKERKKWVERSGVKYIVLHGLRHNHASDLIEQGESADVVSKRIGHARTSITMDIYVHPRPEQQVKAVNKYAENLFGEQKEQIRKDG
ncbi:tyrosine-type recombinase/integrase [Alicyclobacillus fodiniaquatilis]|uniref:Tyrosine-type recombinase/integrase n=1 Tax=Alicyclobacillus fodiniaquatilis TaxID=1661150 RepID=A0ABW4JDB1_9BACL